MPGLAVAKIKKRKAEDVEKGVKKQKTEERCEQETPASVKRKRFDMMQREVEFMKSDEDLPLPSDEQGGAFLVGITGRRKSGKTYLLNDFMQTIWLREFDKIYVLSKTAKHQDYFQSWKGNIKFVEDCHEGFFEEIKEEALAGKKKKKKILVVIDDMSTHMREKLYASNIDEFSFIGRHLGISVVWLGQRITLFTPGFRQESDAFIIFREENMNELRLLHREWGFGELDSFLIKLIENLQEKYAWIMLRNVGGTIKIFKLPDSLSKCKTEA
jgi:AAA+ ATPase superfamily predicted ATPase